MGMHALAKILVALLIATIVGGAVVATTGGGEWTRIEDTIYTGFKVGIGTDNPKAELHVVGDAIVTGALRAGEIIEGGTPISSKYASYAYIHAHYYNKSLVDKIVLGNVTALKAWIGVSYYDKDKIDALILGNVTELRNWVNSVVLGNRSEIERWVSTNFAPINHSHDDRYYTKPQVDALILGNYSDLKNWVLINYYNKTKADQHILGNVSDVKAWVQSNYYDKATIDSWNLIKNYVLQQNLDANGHSIVNVGSLGIGTTNPRAKLEVVGDVMLSNPDGRYIRFFFGTLNDIEFNSTALIIHPMWKPGVGYNPSGLVFFGGDPDYIKVGIGTDAPAYRLDVAGDARISGALHAEYFRLTEGYCWGSVTGSCSGWEIDYYPEGSMVFRYTNDSGQTFTDMMKIYPFGVAMPFIFDKTMISRLEKIETFGKTVNGWTTVLDTDYHGVVAIIFHNPWGAIDYVRVTIDGVTSTIPIDGHTTAEVPLPLVFVVDKHIKVELYSATSVNVYYTVMWVKG